MDYYKKLKDPRWQKKRLEILKKHDWACQHCKSKTDTLNVHHINYETGKNPWEYSDEKLLVLCEKCHKRYHELEKIIKESLSIIFTNFSDSIPDDFPPHVTMFYVAMAMKWMNKFDCILGSVNLIKLDSLFKNNYKQQ